jgi:acetyl-CoA carboxylase biotin carboxylase subunit
MSTTSSAQPLFSKILVANRGEIAVRIMRACRELGIRSVAVYSDPDRSALHTRAADETVALGGSAAAETYLDSAKIIAVAQTTGAQAIHPGYGFLSENAGFAEAVEAAGLVFIGPPPQAMRAMGDKAESKISMKKAGVPTIPGRENLPDLEAFLRAGKELGYPLLVKAAAGGGGKGMRVVREAAEMAEALETARREALGAFGDPRLLVEKYIEHARHVEIQVLGDRYGTLLHLYERECSTQRRHQKIIEESPAAVLDEHLRASMGASALAAARAVNYHNAGTVEFIFDPTSSEYYFLEMNTRLQVEHPVTELVTGLDLVQWQIRVAAGEALPFTQQDISQRGHAIECRIYAEDPSNRFLPCTGQVLAMNEPRGPGIRLDTGISEGSQVSHYYDPLLAKLIVHASNRPAAIRRMQCALDELVLHGVTCNVAFLQAVLAHPDFEAGLVTTQWVENTFAGWELPQISLEILAAAALAENSQPHKQTDPQLGEADPHSPWKAENGFRLGDRRA